MFGARNFMGLYVAYAVCAVITVTGIYLAVRGSMRLGVILLVTGILGLIITGLIGKKRNSSSSSSIFASGGGATAINLTNMPRGENYVPADVYAEWEATRAEARQAILDKYGFVDTPEPPKYIEGFDPTPYITTVKDAKMGGAATAAEFARIKAILDANISPAYTEWVRSFEGGAEQDRELADWDMDYAIQNYPLTKPYISNMSLPIKVWNARPSAVARVGSFLFG